MGPLTTFTDKEVLEDIPPSNWVKSCHPDWQNPLNEKVAAAEPAELMQEGSSWWPVAEDDQGHISLPSC